MRTSKLESLKGDGSSISLVRQIVNLEKVTGLKIDARTDSVERFREIQELAREEIAAQRKAS